MKKFILCAALVLAGCATQQKEVLVQHDYVVRTAPSELKKIPPYPAGIDVQKANQLELAQWLANNEQYIYSLEAKIKLLIEFYEKPVDSTAPAAPAPAASK